MTLADVKQSLNIDFNDQDTYLTTLMNSAFNRAKTMTGLNLQIESIQTDSPEAYVAVLDDIAVMYQNRGEKESVSETSTSTYRRLSVRPMF